MCYGSIFNQVAGGIKPWFDEPNVNGVHSGTHIFTINDKSSGANLFVHYLNNNPEIIEVTHHARLQS